MTIREREYRTHNDSWSILTNEGGPYQSGFTSVGLRRIVDTVATGDGHGMNIRHQDFTPYPVGSGVSDKWNYVFNNVPLNFVRTISQPTHVTVPGEPTHAVLAAELLAKTNPSRPVVDIPVFIGELWDLPDLVRKAGGGLLREIASGNLKYQFGIRPLVSDLSAMLNFTDHTDRRFRELKALQKSGLRRKRNLWDGSASAIGAVVGSGSPFNTTYRETKTTSVKAWGFVKWFPQGNFPTTDRELLKTARRAVLGLTLDGATAWELIPFSWLVDWFANVGDFLQASRNIVPASHSIPQIMKDRHTRGSYTMIEDKTGLYPPRFTGYHRERSRNATPATLSAHLPLLSLRQMSILGSLAILRSGRYH